MNRPRQYLFPGPLAPGAARQVLALTIAMPAVRPATDVILVAQQHLYAAQVAANKRYLSGEAASRQCSLVTSTLYRAVTDLTVCY